MKKLIYLVFEGPVHASFTRSEDFDVDMWAMKHNDFLKEIGVKKIKFEEVPDDFLPWWEES